jgi:hypothetical protein
MGHEFYSIRRLICLRGVYINDICLQSEVDAFSCWQLKRKPGNVCCTRKLNLEYEMA